jgi:hypothetical protein
MRYILATIIIVGACVALAGLADATGQYHGAQAAAPADEPLPGVWGQLEQAAPDTPAWLCIVPVAIVAAVVLAYALTGWRDPNRPGGAQGYNGYKADMDEATAQEEAARWARSQPLPGSTTDALQAAREAIKNTRGLTAEGKRRRLAELLEETDWTGAIDAVQKERR